MSVQQKRRFDAKGTPLERHGIDDRADDRKRITGTTWNETCRTEPRAMLKGANLCGGIPEYGEVVPAVSEVSPVIDSVAISKR